MPGRNLPIIGACIVGTALLLILIHGKVNEPGCRTVLSQLQPSVSDSGEFNVSSQSKTANCEAQCRPPFRAAQETAGKARKPMPQASVNCNTSSELELIQQMRVAHWTAYIAGLTGIGLLLLAGTLWEALRTTQVFSEASHRELRAYIYPTSTNIRCAKEVEALRTFHVRIPLINGGKTLAHNVQQQFEAVYHDSIGQEILLHSYQTKDPISLGPGQDMGMFVYFDLLFLKEELEAIKTQKAYVRINARITYTDYMGEPRKTSIAYVTDEFLASAQLHWEDRLVASGDNSAT